MAYPRYLRERARQLRIEKLLTLDEIAERLALPKTTVYYWIRDLPLGRARRENCHPGTLAMQAKYRRLREQAYERGWTEYDDLVRLLTFRDFVVLYIAEGYKRSRNTVSLCNSDPSIVWMATNWMRRLSGKSVTVKVQFHADQDGEALTTFWSTSLGVPVDAVRLLPKSNSGQLRSRVWRCRYGVAAVEIYDTLFRARLQAWIDRTAASWRLDS